MLLKQLKIKNSTVVVTSEKCKEKQKRDKLEKRILKTKRLVLQLDSDSCFCET